MFRNLRGFVLGTLRAWRRRQDMNHPFFFQPTQLTSYFRWDPRKWLPGSLRSDGLVGSVGFCFRVLMRDGTPGFHWFPPAMG